MEQILTDVTITLGKEAPAKGEGFIILSEASAAAVLTRIATITTLITVMGIQTARVKTNVGTTPSARVNAHERGEGTRSNGDERSLARTPLVSAAVAARRAIEKS